MDSSLVPAIPSHFLDNVSGELRLRSGDPLLVLMESKHPFSKTGPATHPVLQSSEPRWVCLSPGLGGSLRAKYLQHHLLLSDQQRESPPAASD
ncbi:unnamed protein product [Boreogadus saida]